MSVLYETEDLPAFLREPKKVCECVCAQQTVHVTDKEYVCAQQTAHVIDQE